MRSKKVKQILGIGIIVVIIAGVVFIFTRLNKPAEQEQAMQTAPKFLTEETATEPVVEDEEFKWLDNTNISVDPILITEDVVLRSEPRDASSEVMKLTKDMQGKRVAISTDLDGNDLGWCRVFVNGKAGYLDHMTFDYILPADNIVVEDDTLPADLAKEIEGRQITIVEPETAQEEVTEQAEKPADGVDKDTEKKDSIVTPKVEETPTKTETPAKEEAPKQETQPTQPTTPPTQEQPSQPATNPSTGLTPEGQALYEKALSLGGRDSSYVDEHTSQGTPATGVHDGLTWE